MSLPILVLLGSFLTTADAKKPDTQPLIVRVVQADGTPISQATVSPAADGETHSVNAVTGEWQTQAFVLPDGSVQPLVKGEEIRFVVAAEGYEEMKVRYTIRKRANVIPIVLMPAK